MRRLVATVICAVSLSAQAQVPPFTTQMLMPSPLGIVLMVGKWIYDSSSNQEVYYIEVAGDGATAQDSRMNGFRLAVEQALGTLISSETEVKNGRLIRDEIISYAAGYVDRFEIIKQELTATGVRTSMRVWVKKSALSDRLLNRSAISGQVDGARASVQLQTLNHERATGDAILQQVLNDFPKRAFDIELKPTDILRHNRSAYMEINFKISWNRDYLRSLWTALEATSQRNNRPVATVQLGSGSWFGGFGGEARFDDKHKLELMADRMFAQGPVVLVRLKSSANDVLFANCYVFRALEDVAHVSVAPERFVQFNGSNARINGGFVMPGRIQIPVAPDVLSRINTIDMDVVLRKQCPNR